MTEVTTTPSSRTVVGTVAITMRVGQRERGNGAVLLLLLLALVLELAALAPL